MLCLAMQSKIKYRQNISNFFLEAGTFWIRRASVWICCSKWKAKTSGKRLQKTGANFPAYQNVGLAAGQAGK